MSESKYQVDVKTPTNVNYVCINKNYEEKKSLLTPELLEDLKMLLAILLILTLTLVVLLVKVIRFGSWNLTKPSNPRLIT